MRTVLEAEGSPIAGGRMMILQSLASVGCKIHHTVHFEAAVSTASLTDIAGCSKDMDGRYRMLVLQVEVDCVALTPQSRRMEVVRLTWDTEESHMY